MVLAPLLRQYSVRSLCCPALAGSAATWPSASSLHAAFHTRPIALHPRHQSSGPPRPPLQGGPPRPALQGEPSRKPEDLYPESFPIDEKDLVNPSGRIYSVRRPPNEDADDVSKVQSRILENFKVPMPEAKPPRIFRPVLFVVVGATLIYFAAAKYSLVQSEEMADEVLRGGIFGSFSSFFGLSGNEERSREEMRRQHGAVSEAQIRAAFKHQVAEKMGWRLKWLMGWCDQLHVPEGGKQFVGRIFLWGAEGYLNLPQYKEALVPVIAINTVVFLSWRLSMLPSLRNSLERFMIRYFLHAAASGRSFTMLTSTFSHRGGLHFLLNNVALWSFGASALAVPAFYYGADVVGNPLVGKHTAEASKTPHFLAFFAAAGLFSCLASHLGSALRFRFVALRKGLEGASWSVGRVGSLGSSGAVYSLMVMYAFTNPEASLGLILLPGVMIPIQTGMLMLVSFDVLGVVLRLKLFDHVAHLGGAAFGWLYFRYGNLVWETCKARIRQYEGDTMAMAPSDHNARANVHTGPTARLL